MALPPVNVRVEAETGQFNAGIKQTLEVMDRWRKLSGKMAPAVKRLGEASESLAKSSSATKAALKETNKQLERAADFAKKTADKEKELARQTRFSAAAAERRADRDRDSAKAALRSRNSTQKLADVLRDMLKDVRAAAQAFKRLAESSKFLATATVSAAGSVQNSVVKFDEQKAAVFRVKKEIQALVKYLKNYGLAQDNLKTKANELRAIQIRHHRTLAEERAFLVRSRSYVDDLAEAYQNLKEHTRKHRAELKKKAKAAAENARIARIELRLSNQIKAASQSEERSMKFLTETYRKLNLVISRGITVRQKLRNTSSRLRSEISRGRRNAIKWAEAVQRADGKMNRMNASAGRLSAKLASLSAQWRRLAGLVTAFTAVIGGRALAMFVEMEARNRALAASAGLTVTQFTQWSNVFRLFGQQAEKVNDIFSEINVKAADAAVGTKGIVEAFQVAGVAIRDEAGNLRDNVEIFQDLLDVLEKESVQTTFSADAIFGGDVARQALLPLARLGREQRDFLLNLFKEDADTTEKFKGEIQSLHVEIVRLTVGLRTGMTKALGENSDLIVDVIGNIRRLFTDALPKLLKFIDRVRRHAILINLLIAALTSAVVVKKVLGLAGAFRKFASATLIAATSLSWVGVLLAAVAAIVAGGIVFYNLERIRKWFKDIQATMFEFAGSGDNVLDTVTDAEDAIEDILPTLDLFRTRLDALRKSTDALGESQDGMFDELKENLLAIGRDSDLAYTVFEQFRTQELGIVEVLRKEEEAAKELIEDISKAIRSEFFKAQLIYSPIDESWHLVSDQVDDLNGKMEEAKENLDEIRDRITRIETAADAGKAYREALDEINSELSEMQQVAEIALYGIGDAFVEVAFEGNNLGQSLKRVFKRIVAQLFEVLVVTKLVAKALAALDFQYDFGLGGVGISQGIQNSVPRVSGVPVGGSRGSQSDVPRMSGSNVSNDALRNLSGGPRTLIVNVNGVADPETVQAVAKNTFGPLMEQANLDLVTSPLLEGAR